MVLVEEGITHAVQYETEYRTVIACGWWYEGRLTETERALAHPITCLECLSLQGAPQAGEDPRRP
jgi:hypothetical protein